MLGGRLARRAVIGARGKEPRFLSPAWFVALDGEQVGVGLDAEATPTVFPTSRSIEYTRPEQRMCCLLCKGPLKYIAINFILILVSSASR